MEFKNGKYVSYLSSECVMCWWYGEFSNCLLSRNIYLIQNSQAVKKVCGPQKGYGEKRCEIQGGGQEMAVMVG